MEKCGICRNEAGDVDVSVICDECLEKSKGLSCAHDAVKRVYREGSPISGPPAFIHWECSRCGETFYPNEQRWHEAMQSTGALEVAQETATLRDHFAMAALTGLWSGEAVISAKISAQHSLKVSARIAYEIADAMLEASKK